MPSSPPPSSKDRIYSSYQRQLGAFAFNDQVAKVFDDMINRSVPGYGMTLDMISVITETYAQAGTQCFDLGCSLGGSTFAMRQGLLNLLARQAVSPTNNYRITGVDNSSAMVQRCTENLRQLNNAASTDGAIQTPSVHTDILCQDIMNTSIENASVITLNFTLQFLPPIEREQLLTRINQGLEPGGVLILSEKIAFDDPSAQEMMTQLHHGFKRNEGYSDLEIAQKRSAIENVLIPESLTMHTERLQRSGFSQIQTWFQCFNFISLLAIK